VTVIDDRAEFANQENIPDAHDLIVHEFERAFEQVPVGNGTFIVVATRGHNHDLDAVKAALRTPAFYIGLLGSKRKRALLRQSLTDSGFSPADIDRVIIPVGMEIDSVTPEEIAVSIMAQIIQKRREHGASRGCPASCGRSVQENGDAEAAAAARR
jgi:xanthine dehydrogenase accessory factor